MKHARHTLVITHPAMRGAFGLYPARYMGDLLNEGFRVIGHVVASTDKELLALLKMRERQQASDAALEQLEKQMEKRE